MHTWFSVSKKGVGEGEFEFSSLSEEGGPGRLPWMCTETCRSSVYAHKILSPLSLSTLKTIENRNIVYWEPTLHGVQNRRVTGTSLVVQWLRLHAPNAGGMGLIPGRGRSHMPHGTAKKKESQSD